jgi:hypothetical protein
MGKLISVPRPKVMAAERQVQLAHSPVEMRAHEPPSQLTEMWAGGCEIVFHWAERRLSEARLRMRWVMVREWRPQCRR